MSSEQVIEADKQQAELFLLMGVPEAFQSFLVSDDVKGVRWRYDEKFDFLVAYWPDSEGLMQELDAQMAGLLEVNIDI